MGVVVVVVVVVAVVVAVDVATDGAILSRGLPGGWLRYGTGP